MSMHMNNWVMIGAAFVGIVSAAGIMIAEYHKQERKKHSMSTDLARLDKQVALLKSQLEKLQKNQKTSAEAKTRTKKTPVKSYSSAMSAVSDDYNSTREMDSSDLEFYDLSDEETSKASTITPLDTQVLKDIDERLNSGDNTQLTSVLQMLENLSYEYPESSDVLWRMGKTYHKLASDPEKAESKVDNLKKGLEVCEQGINLNSECFEAHKWYVLITGALIPTKPARERIKDSIGFKVLLDKTLKMRPTDTALLHSLGRYHFEISSLKWYEKKILTTLVGEMPDASYEQALKYLLQADELSPQPWKDNKLAIAKCYININNFTDALKWLDAAKDIEPLNLAHSVDSEIENLLTKYNTYRTK